MTMHSNIKKVTDVDWRVAGSVVVGIGIFGLFLWGVRTLPTNAVTTPIKKAAEVVAN